MLFRFFASLFLASTSLIACSPPEESVTLHGTWKSEDGIEHPASIEASEQGLEVSLTIRLEGHSCLSESKLTAKLSTDGFDTSSDVAGMHLDLTGHDLDALTGDFEALEAGPCEKGWVSVFR